jgi:pilus assembly protein CpaB
MALTKTKHSSTRSGLIFMAVTVVLGLIVAGLAMATVQSFNEQAQVVVATKEIQPFTEITADQVKVASIPARAKSSDTFVNIKDVVGKVSRTHILPNEQIRPGHLVDGVTDRSLLATQLSQFKDPKIRAFAIPIDHLTGLGGADKLQPGDRVDIIGNLKLNLGQQEVAVTKTILRNIQILGFIKNPDSEKQTAGVILAVTPAQAEDLSFAMANGTLRLSLNPYETDAEASNTTGMSAVNFLHRYGFTVIGGEAPQTNQQQR